MKQVTYVCLPQTTRVNRNTPNMNTAQDVANQDGGYQQDIERILMATNSTNQNNVNSMWTELLPIKTITERNIYYLHISEF